MERPFHPAAPSAAIFEFIELSPGEVGIVLGDVSGKARLPRCSRRSCRDVRRRSGHQDSPASILSRINRRLLARHLEAPFVTLLMPSCRLMDAVYANAGHNPPALLLRTACDRSPEAEPSLAPSARRSKPPSRCARATP
jgi:serine phosphatase RsbU (regulator of sigma subunit)